MGMRPGTTPIRTWRAIWPMATLALCLALIPNDPASSRVLPHGTERVSVDTSGNQASGGSVLPAVSGDGRVVAFVSEAADLVGGDTNGFADVFVRDRQQNITTRVSVSSSGAEANGNSWMPVISGDGRYVAFESWASNLVAGDSNDAADVFVYDRLTATSQRVSVGSDGSEAAGASGFATLSRDGRFVGFTSNATNLVTPDSNGAEGDVFVHDLQTGDTTRVSVATNGEQANDPCNGPLSISADGRSVAYHCRASNLTASDTNGQDDVFVHHLGTGTTEAVSVDDYGVPVGGRDAAMSGDGRFVAFLSFSESLAADDTNGTGDIFLRDTHLDRTAGVSINALGKPGNGFSGGASISAGGDFVAFYSAAEDLVPRDDNGTYDVFLYSAAEGGISQLSLAGTGPPPSDGGAQAPSISADGHLVAFQSDATNQVRSDTNGRSDVFVFDTRGCPGVGAKVCSAQ